MTDTTMRTHELTEKAALEAGDVILLDNSGDSLASKHEAIASLTNAGLVELATEAEVSAGVDATRAVTPAGAEALVNAQLGGDASSNVKSNNGIGLGTNNTASYGGVAGGYGNTANGNAYEQGAVALGRANSAPSNGIALGAQNTASGQKAIAIGYLNQATAAGAIAIGTVCEANGPYGVAIGDEAVNRYWGQMAIGGAPFSTKDNQTSLYQLLGTTTNATPAALYVNGGGDILSIPSDNLFVFQIQLGAMTADGAVAAAWIFQGAIKNAGGTTGLVGAITTALHVNDGGAAAWAAAVTAVDATDELRLTVTGAAGTTIRWRAMVLVSEMLFT